MNRLPFKLKPSQPVTSRFTAERRLNAIECMLERDPDLKIKYHKFTNEYEELSHREPVNSQMGKKTCYCPKHHPVFKETSVTTKTLIEFDGNAVFQLLSTSQ